MFSEILFQMWYFPSPNAGFQSKLKKNNLASKIIFLYECRRNLTRRRNDLSSKFYSFRDREPH